MMQLVFFGFSLCVSIAGIAQTNATTAAKSWTVAEVVGHYRLASGQILTLEPYGDSVTIKSRGQTQRVLTRTQEGRFTFPSGDSHLTFDTEPSSGAPVLKYHSDENTQTATRIDNAAFKADSDAWDLKIRDQSPSPDCATSVKRLVDEMRAGAPDYSKLSPSLSRTVRSQLTFIQPRFAAAGATKDVKFKSVDPTGNEIFEVTFDNGSVSVWRVLCLGPGHIGSAAFRL